MCGSSGVANMDGFMLREGGQCPQNVIVFMLTWPRMEEEDGCAEEWADNGLLKGGNDAGVDSGIHDVVFHSIETVGEDIIVPHDTHVARNRHGRLVCVSGWR